MPYRVLSRLFQVLTGVVLGLALVYLVLRPKVAEQSTDADEYFLAQPLPAPHFSLTTQDGRRVSLEDFSGKLVVMFFGYTSCPDVCPLTLSHLSQAFEEMGENGEHVQVLFVSVDPERDTAQRVKRYLQAFHPSFLGLTGTEAQIREVASGFGVYFAKHGSGDDYTVDHTARTFVIDTRGTIPLTFPVTATPKEMARDLKKLLEEEP